MSEKNIQTVQTIYEAFGKGDVPTILGKLADDVAWDQESPSWGLPWLEPRHGIGQIGGFFSALVEHLHIRKFVPTNFLAGGDMVAVTIDIEVEIKRTGRVMKELEVHLWTFGADGKVKRFAHVLDRHGQVAAFRGQDP